MIVLLLITEGSNEKGKSEEEGEEEGLSTEEKLLTLAASLLIMGFGVENFIGSGPNFLFNLRPTTISPESMSLYKRIRKNVIRLVANTSLLLILYYSYALHLAWSSGIVTAVYGFALLAAFTPIVLIGIIPCFGILRALVDQLLIRERTWSRFYVKRQSFFSLLFLLFFMLFSFAFVIPTSKLLNGDSGFRGPELVLLIIGYFLIGYFYLPATFIIFPLAPLSYALIFIIVYPPLFYVLEKQVYRADLAQERPGRDPVDFLKLAWKIREAKMKKRNKEKPRKLRRHVKAFAGKIEEKLPDYEKGFLALYSLPPFMKPMSKKACRIFASAIFSISILIYLALPPLSLLTLLLTGYVVLANHPEGQDVLIRFQKPETLRLVPEKPEKIVETYFGRFLKAYTKFFMVPFVLFSLIILLPLRSNYYRIEYAPDITHTLILGVIIPAHILSIILLERGSGYLEKSSSFLKDPTRIELLIHSLLFLPYAISLFLKFDFTGNLLQSALLHLLAALGLVLFTRKISRLSLLDFLHNNRFSRDHPTPDIKIFKRRIWKKQLMVGLILLFMLGSTFYPADLELSEGIQTWDYEKTPVPEENILLYQENTLIQDETLSLDQNLLIEAQVIFKNCSLEFLKKNGSRTGFFVLNGGYLILEDCSLTGPDYFLFVVRGRLEVEGSEISRVWGRSDVHDMEGGIELYTPQKVSFRDTVIQDCPANGIMAVETTFSLSNCQLRNMGSDAIEARECYITIVNCTVEDCAYGIAGDDSNLDISGTTIRDAKKGNIAPGAAESSRERNNSFQEEKEIDLPDMSFLTEPMKIPLKLLFHPYLINAFFFCALIYIILPERSYWEVKRKLEKQGGEGL